MAGRGGAGNIEAARKTYLMDPETLQAPVRPDVDLSSTKKGPDSNRELLPVAFSGRGGAGNTFDPIEPQRTGNFGDVSPSVEIPGSLNHEVNVAQAERQARMTGRGGAGNYEPEVGLRKGDGKSPHSSQTVEWPMFPQAEDDVEKGLAKPGAAYLGPKERKK